MATATPAAVEAAHEILSLAGIPSVDSYPAEERGALRVVPALGLRSVSVDAMVARRHGPVLATLAKAREGFELAGWDVVPYGPDSFRADPPEVAEQFAAAERIRRAEWIRGRLAEIEAERDALAVELAELTD